MLLAGSVSGRPHSKWWWCHDIGYPLLAAEHSQCKAPWSGSTCWTTSVHSRTMSPLDSTWKPSFSLATSVHSTLETSCQLCYINSHSPLPLHYMNIESTRIIILSNVTALWFVRLTNNVIMLRKYVAVMNMFLACRIRSSTNSWSRCCLTGTSNLSHVQFLKLLQCI